MAACPCYPAQEHRQHANPLAKDRGMGRRAKVHHPQRKCQHLLQEEAAGQAEALGSAPAPPSWILVAQPPAVAPGKSASFLISEQECPSHRAEMKISGYTALPVWSTGPGRLRAGRRQLLFPRDSKGHQSPPPQPSPGEAAARLHSWPEEWETMTSLLLPTSQLRTGAQACQLNPTHPDPSGPSWPIQPPGGQPQSWGRAHHPSPWHPFSSPSSRAEALGPDAQHKPIGGLVRDVTELHNDYQPGLGWAGLGWGALSEPHPAEGSCWASSRPSLLGPGSSGGSPGTGIYTEPAPRPALGRAA